LKARHVTCHVRKATTINMPNALLSQLLIALHIESNS